MSDTLDIKKYVSQDNLSYVVKKLHKADEDLKAVVGSASVAAVEEQGTVGEEGYVAPVEAKAATGLIKRIEDLEKDTTVSAKVATLIGDDENKSVRTIANEELAKQLVPEDAKESLDTLQEIAAWIQSHPDDAAAMNLSIETLEGVVGKAAVAAETHEATQDDVDAGKAENVGDEVVDKAAVPASGLVAKVDTLETKVAALEDADLDSKYDELGAAEAVYNAFKPLTNAEIDAMFVVE